MKQNFGSMPQELLEQPRWFLVGADKRPLTKAWSNPENQSRYDEISGVAGFDCCGHGVGDDYCLLDFDHVIGDGGMDEEVAAILRYLFKTGCYIEYSISKRGFHVLLKPTPGKFGKITNSEGKGILWFNKNNDAKLEIFYLSAGRYCLLTGDNFFFDSDFIPACDKIPAGKEADEFLEILLDMIHKQFQAATPKQAAQVSKPTDQPKTRYENSRDYDEYRFGKMIDCVPIRNLRGDDWLAAMTACKNFGMTYAEFDALNVGGETYNAEENLRRWNSINAVGDWLGTLHNLAKQFGYSEADTLKEWRRLNPSTLPAKRATAKGDRDKLTDEDLQFLLSGGGSDTENADRLAFMFHDEVKFHEDDGTWYILKRNELGGSVWKRYDRKDAVYPHVRRLSDTILANAIQIPKTLDGFEIVKTFGKKGTEYGLKPQEKISGAGKVVDLAAHRPVLERLGEIVKEHNRQVAIGNKLRSARSISSAIEILKGNERIRITADDLNRHTNLLCVQNGVVDLLDGKLYESCKDFLPTNQINAVFDTQVDSSFVKNFFSQVLPDDETCAAVLRYLGFCLTGDKSFHVSEFWRGSGANGKSTVIDLLLKTFGSYSLKLPSLSLIQSNRPLDANAATPALASLGGDVRLAIVDELPRGVRLNAELFKTITGDATARARFLHCNLETIPLRAKLILNGNHLPQFDVDDGGMKRRINNVEFTQTFTGNRADSLLPKKLATDENRAALLKILVQESIQFYKSGLLESTDMKLAKDNYLAENDFISDFADEQLIFGDGGSIPRKTLVEKLCAAYPAETRRLKKKELFDLLRKKLEALGAEYTKGKLNANIFNGVKLAE